MNSTAPIFTIHLFPELDGKLIELLQSLSPADWQKQTPAPLWKVHDVVLHLLDGNIRALSMLRDGYFGVKPDPINAYQDLVDYLNQLNADWITGMKRVSPEVLIDLLVHTGQQYNAFLATLDPFAPAAFSVAWAGENESANWFHIARDYTEKWHHQQQIRFAVGQEQVLYSKALYQPYLETSMRALPHHYRNVKAGENDVIQFIIDSEAGGEWYLQFNGNEWNLVVGTGMEPVCKVEIESDVAWRIFTKGIMRQAAALQVKVTGRKDLGEKILDMLAVMA